MNFNSLQKGSFDEKRIGNMDIFEKTIFFRKSIIFVLEQIIGGEDINTCKCSYYPLRGTIEMALNGDLGVTFSLLLVSGQINFDIVDKLAKKLATNNL